MTTALSLPHGQVDTSTSTAPTISQPQKAAIIVRLMLDQGEKIALSSLPDSIQRELVQQMAGLTYVDQQTVDAVTAEFLAAFDAKGLSFPGALESALDMMESVVSKETTSLIRKQAGLDMFSDPWSRICGLEIGELTELVTAESTEIGAVILSKLDVSMAAELLGQLPGESARRITYAVSLTDNISPRLVQQIGQSLAQQMATQPDREFSDGPVERVGEILNFSPAATRDDVLEGLDQADQQFASNVRKAIFTFNHIPLRIDPKEVPNITKEVNPENLLTALAGATGEETKVVDFFLSNMSQRMADQLREDMEELGDVGPSLAEKAMTAVVITIRQLADAGTIKLIVETEEAED